MTTTTQLSRALGAIMPLAETRAAIISAARGPEDIHAIKAAAAVTFSRAVQDGEPDAIIERAYKAYQQAAWRAITPDQHELQGELP